eukprot:jgi/Tetstr1/420774/TSEL_011851.t1
MEAGELPTTTSRSARRRKRRRSARARAAAAEAAEGGADAAADGVPPAVVDAHRRAAKLTAVQELRRARQALDTVDLGMVSDAAAALPALDALHPPPAATGPEYSPPKNRRTCNGRHRRHVDWWRWEHIRDLDVPSWRLWVNRCLAGRCHSRTAAFLASGSVFALHKDDPAAREEREKSGEPLRVRPFGVGSVLVRLASAHALGQVGADAQEVMGPAGFLSRMMPPLELDSFLAAVDAANISAAFSLLGLDACNQSTPRMEAAIVQMSMPADFGGLNLALLQSEAPAAFYSAQSVVLPKLMLEQMGVIGQIEEDLAKSDLDGDEDGKAPLRGVRSTQLGWRRPSRTPTGCHGVFQVTVQSGWVMEDCWHHMETFYLLTAGALFKEARVKAIMTEKELASPAVMRSVSQLAVLGHMYKRLQGAAWFVTRWGLQNVVTEEDGPERKAQMDALIREGRTRYLAAITVYARMAEGNGFVSLLVSNLHSAVCRVICLMLACGHPLAELWMENFMGFLKAGAKRVLPKNGYMAPDDAGPSAVETPIRLVGSASAAWESAVGFKDHLKRLLDDVRPATAARRPARDPSAPPPALAPAPPRPPSRRLGELLGLLGRELRATALVDVNCRRRRWRERSLARLDNPLSPISLLDPRLLRLLTRRIKRIIVAWQGVPHPPATAPSAVADAVVAGCCEEVALDIGAGLGVCRRESCEAMDTVRDAKSG